MKIKRIVTYEVTKEDIENFFDEEGWNNSTGVGEKEFEYLKESLVMDYDYEKEEWIFLDGSKELITKIWQKQFEKYHHKGAR